MMDIPPLIRELTSRFSSYLHLKAVVGPSEHDHNKPTLCGQEDHGSGTYAVPKSQEEFERLVRENGPDAVYPLCPYCAAAFTLGQEGKKLTIDCDWCGKTIDENNIWVGPDESTICEECYATGGKKDVERQG
jgi:hypothetical protein